MEQDLKKMALDMLAKASGIEANLIIIVETEDKTGFDFFGTGHKGQLSKMISQAARENKTFGEIFHEATLINSRQKIDDLLKKNNPFVRNEEGIKN